MYDLEKFLLQDLLKYIQIKEYDLSKSKGIVEDLDEVLNEYSDVIDLSETRYEKTIQGFKYRVNWLEKYKNKDDLKCREES